MEIILCRREALEIIDLLKDGLVVYHSIAYWVYGFDFDCKNIIFEIFI